MPPTHLTSTWPPELAVDFHRYSRRQVAVGYRIDDAHHFVQRADQILDQGVAGIHQLGSRTMQVGNRQAGAELARHVDDFVKRVGNLAVNPCRALGMRAEKSPRRKAINVVSNNLTSSPQSFPPVFVFVAIFNSSVEGEPKNFRVRWQSNLERMLSSYRFHRAMKDASTATEPLHI